METASGKKIRIGEAAAAIGATPKSLRHWISRYAGKGVKPSAPQTGGWLEFSFGDVAAFAITKYLVDLGMDAPCAFTVAMRLVELRFPNLFDVDDPRWKFDASLNQMDFYFGRGLFPWGFSNFERSETPEEVARTYADNLKDKDFPARVRVTFSLIFILHDAFEALAEMGHRMPRGEGVIETKESTCKE
jgi:MerR HTH family regulatory protein